MELDLSNLFKEKIFLQFFSIRVSILFYIIFPNITDKRFTTCYVSVSLFYLQYTIYL